MAGKDALSKITKEAQKMRVAKPGIKWATAVKQASAKYRAGSLGKPLAKKPAKMKVIAGGKAKRKRIAAKPVVVGKSKPVDGRSKIVSLINGLELARKKAVGATAKNAIQVIINQQHDKLDKLKR